MTQCISFLKTTGVKIVAAMLFVALLFSVATTKVVSASSMTKTEELESMFTNEEIMDISITELSEVMESGRATSVEIVQMYLDRIYAYDLSQDLNSIIAVNPDALELAAEADKVRAAGGDYGVLLGVPIVVKDNYDYEDLATTAGSTALWNSIANDDAFTIQRLEDAGAIIIAKANMSEFAKSGSNSRSAIGGTVHNAYDTSKTPAGSSGGTAVAVASNFATAGLGTDTGSSIRRPSSYGDLFGLRPSKGLTSIDGVVPLNADQDVTGPMCNTASDLAIMMDAIAGTDENDRYTVEFDADSMIPEDGYTSYLTEDALEGKRIGYLQNSFGYTVSTSLDKTTGEYVSSDAGDNTQELDEKIVDLVDYAKDNLVEGGVELVDMSEIITDQEIFTLSGACSVTLDGSNTFAWDMYEYFNALGDNATMNTVADIIASGGYMSSLDSSNVAEYDLVNPRYEVEEDGKTLVLDEDGNPIKKEAYDQMQTARVTFRETMTEYMEEYDLDAIMYIAHTDVACEEVDSGSSDYDVINANRAAYLNKFGPVAGLPDIMIPMGYSGTDEETETSMPLGMSMFGKYGDDETLIQIAYGYEQQVEKDYAAPSTTPVLSDEELNAFIEATVVESFTLDSAEYTTDSYEALFAAATAAIAVDKTDVASTKSAAQTLAAAYDALVETDETDGAEISGCSSSVSSLTTTLTLAFILVAAGCFMGVRAKRRSQSK